MASISPTPHSSLPGQGEPAWDIALLYPRQGSWSEDEYLQLSEDSNHLIEFIDGHIEVLEMPTTSHQRMMLFMWSLLNNFVSSRKLGEVLCAPLPMAIRQGKFREPDVLFMSEEKRHLIGEASWQGADLVVEIVSSDQKSRDRDLIKKRRDYAEGGIPEYWIVDPVAKQITVLALDGKAYTEHGVFSEGETATSKLLEGFSVDVTAVFQAAKA